jgi:hypothetical protein
MLSQASTNADKREQKLCQPIADLLLLPGGAMRGRQPGTRSANSQLANIGTPMNRMKRLRRVDDCSEAPQGWWSETAFNFFISQIGII